MHKYSSSIRICIPIYNCQDHHSKGRQVKVPFTNLDPSTKKIGSIWYAGRYLAHENVILLTATACYVITSLINITT